MINESELFEDNAKKAVLRNGNYTVDEVKADETGVTNEECGIEIRVDGYCEIYEGWGSKTIKYRGEGC